MEYWESEIKLSDLMNKGIISLGRGRIISSIDLQKKPGVYPVYSSSSQKGGLFGLYDEFDFDEELLTWSVDGGGHFFYRPKHKFSVTNVSGILKINEPSFDYKFLYYSLVYQHSKEVFDYVDKAHPSVIKKRYNVPNISINEQKKIAEILTNVDEAIENTEQLIQKYEQVKVGLMQDLLTKGIDENGNIRSEETHQFKDSPLGRIPVEWDCNTLGSIYKMKSGITPSRAEKSYFDDNGTNWVKTLDLNEDRLFSTEEKISKKAINFTSISVLPTDSILIAMYGGWEQIGRTSILGKPSATNQAITALFNPSKQLISEYTMFSLQTNRWRWKQFAVSTRKDPNITKKDISNFIIAYPIDEKEQLNIISKIDRVKRYITNTKSTLNKLINQKQGLMQDLLSGKVRVNY